MVESTPDQPRNPPNPATQQQTDRTHQWLSLVPWVLALLGLAVPMLGSGFVGWPFALGWLGVLAFVWLVRPIRGTDRSTALAMGVAAVAILVVLAFEGGLFLIPAVGAWLAITLATPKEASDLDTSGP